MQLEEKWILTGIISYGEFNRFNMNILVRRFMFVLMLCYDWDFPALQGTLWEVPLQPCLGSTLLQNRSSLISTRFIFGHMQHQEWEPMVRMNYKFSSIATSAICNAI